MVFPFVECVRTNQHARLPRGNHRSRFRFGQRRTRLRSAADNSFAPVASRPSDVSINVVKTRKGSILITRKRCRRRATLLVYRSHRCNICFKLQDSWLYHLTVVSGSGSQSGSQFEQLIQKLMEASGDPSKPKL